MSQERNRLRLRSRTSTSRTNQDLTPASDLISSNSRASPPSAATAAATGNISTTAVPRPDPGVSSAIRPPALRRAGARSAGRGRSRRAADRAAHGRESGRTFRTPAHAARGGTPGPSSVTVTLTKRSSAIDAVTRMAVPAGAYLLALSTQHVEHFDHRGRVDRQSRQRVVQGDDHAVFARQVLGARQARADDVVEPLAAQRGRLARRRRSADESPSMNRFSRSDSSSMTCSSSRSPSLDSSDAASRRRRRSAPSRRP